MDDEEIAERAARIEPHDLEQRAILEATMREGGQEHIVRVAHFEGAKPPWQVLKDGQPLSFAGVFIYGGQTRSIALSEARRLAEKWDWTVDEGV